jgi:hypothetical protein
VTGVLDLRSWVDPVSSCKGDFEREEKAGEGESGLPYSSNV